MLTDRSRVLSGAGTARRVGTDGAPRVGVRKMYGSEAIFDKLHQAEGDPQRRERLNEALSIRALLDSGLSIDEALDKVCGRGDSLTGEAEEA